MGRILLVMGDAVVGSSAEDGYDDGDCASWNEDANGGAGSLGPWNVKAPYEGEELRVCQRHEN